MVSVQDQIYAVAKAIQTARRARDLARGLPQETRATVAADCERRIIALEALLAELEAEEEEAA